MNKNDIAYVNIHGNPVPTVLHNGKPHVGMKALCEQMGLQWEAQLKRINRDNHLKATMSIMDIVATDGKTREMVCLPLDMINGWLFGIDAGRVKPEIRERVLAYQRECYVVLYNYWHGKGAMGALTPSDEIRYMNQRLALLRELRHERDLLLREKIYEQFRTVSDRLGYETPALDAFAAPHPHDALDPATRRVLDAFWQAITALQNLAIPVNHHCDSRYLAVNLKEVIALCEDHGIAIPGKIELKRALPQSRVPALIAANHVVRSATCRKSVRCYVFAHEASP